MDKKPPGRPRLSVDPLEQINIRLTKEQLAWLDTEEKRQGRVGRNAVIRMLIEREIARKDHRAMAEKAISAQNGSHEITKM